MSGDADPFSPDPAQRLRAWLDRARDSYLDLIVAGQVFGGRPGESPQRPRAFRLDGEVLTISFEPTEILTVLRPSGFPVAQPRELLVPEAAEVRFGWHYYGRPRTPENWCVLTWRFGRDLVIKDAEGPATAWAVTGSFPKGPAPAVVLRPAW